MRVWLPYESEAEARRRLGELPDGIEIDIFNGGEPPASVDEVEFYVDPYLSTDRAAWERLATMPRLKVVQTLTAGFEHIQRYVPDGVTLCNAAGLHDASTAELAIALSLAVGRRLDEYARNQTTGDWQFGWGNSLADKRVTIIGYGHIGQAIERRLTGFEVGSITRVARSARTETNADGHPVPVQAIDDLPSILPDTDVLILIIPATPQTEKLIDAAALALLPDGAQLINVGRGKLVDTDALLAEAETGRITAGLDVTDPEPLPVDHRLWTTPGVLISPHVGGASSAFQPRADALTADQLRRYAAGDSLKNVIIKEEAMA
ncbi:2-hydroxyacid dehydrogenase [Microlunatus soli]|nr:2-hydroxyacid dehydrogenase [Microlunatus soli]